MSMHRFSYSPLTGGSHLVGLAGDFTDWQILPMVDIGGIYVLNLDIPQGRYAYKFIVDGNWIADENSTETAPDPFGGVHSILEIKDAGELYTWDDVLNHKAHRDFMSYISIFRFAHNSLEFRFTWYPNLADEIMLVPKKVAIKFEKIGRNAIREVYSLFLNELASDILSFHIDIIWGGRHYYLGAEGITQNILQIIEIEVNIKDYPLFETPDWVSKSIIYQIFPDRFYNGNNNINQNFSEWYYADCHIKPEEGEFLPTNKEYYHFVEDWNDFAGLKQSPYLAKGFPDWWSFYGGDIVGVKQKLDYLSELGVDVLYFNPLWKAKSNHKYDSADYQSIDPHFGTPEEMRELVTIAHDRGIRIILDVAFNHTGETFWAFRDCVEKGADSSYWNWYDWHKWPLPSPLPADFKPKEYYQCWWGIKDMPDLNYDLSRHHPEENAITDIKDAIPNMPLVDYILESVRWWLLDIGIDGFRLDVPDEVPFWFWELFRNRVKLYKPDAWIVGEIWHDAHKWVNHRYFDSVMNYAYFKTPVTEFFILHLVTKDEFVRKIESGMALYPNHVLKSMMNLLGSHDTYRIFELAKGDVKAVKQAIIFQMCFIGAPHIYYGDEITMLGGKDPDNRRPFNWDWEKDSLSVAIHKMYCELIKLRKENEVFTEGSFSFISTNDSLLVYTRKLHKVTVTVVQNLSDKPVSVDICNLGKPVYGSECWQDNALISKESVIFFNQQRVWH